MAAINQALYNFDAIEQQEEEEAVEEEEKEMVCWRLIRHVLILPLAC